MIGSQQQFPQPEDENASNPPGDFDPFAPDSPLRDAPPVMGAQDGGRYSAMPQSPRLGTPIPGQTPPTTQSGLEPEAAPDPFLAAPPPGTSHTGQEQSVPSAQQESAREPLPSAAGSEDAGSFLGSSGLPPFLDGGNSPAAEPAGPSSHSADLYAELFGVAPIQKPSTSGGRRSGLLDQVQAPPPHSPKTLKESGLSLSLVCDLILKQLYLHGSLQGVEIARNARLPFNVIDECLRFLKDDRCLEVTSGDVIGRVSYRFHLSEVGRERAKEAFDLCRYVGPAPVALEQYVEQCRRQAVSGINCTGSALLEAFNDLIIPPHLLELLGPAVCSGKSIFLYGPPGNGKSQIAKGLGRFLNQHGGEIYVPYAIQSENGIITIFDPSLHQTTDDDEVAALLGDAASPQTQTDIGRLLHENHPDMRWRRVRRPVVVTGGELTLEMLDLRFNAASNFYVAPLQVKANGGVFMIDDFGRQIVSPKDLLNRWILPLEERIDYVTLDTGKKFPVPFEQLIIFSTNLDPGDLVDDAFLRRIRHKILIDSPGREMYTEIFSLCCEQRKIPFEPRAIEYLYQNFYDQGRLPRSSDPRDLLEIVQSICRFRNQRLVLTQELMSEATSRFFAKV